MNKSLIAMDSVRKIFYTEDVETHALSNIHLHINEGEFISITGPSGCGKSTLLSILGLLDSPSEGRYALLGQKVEALNRRQRAKIRNKEIGFIFQSFNLISDMTVWENIFLPLRYREDLNHSQKCTLVDHALENVAMSHRKRHYPAQLSGGQQQRVAIARAIAGKPAILFADEPTGNLDTNNAKTIMALLDELHRNGATICMVTHAPQLAMHAHRRVHIIDGQIVTDDTQELRV